MTDASTTLVDYARHPTLRRRTRVALAALYAALILLPFSLILFVGVLPQVTIVGMFVAYAFALFPTYYFDHWLLGGSGFHSPVIFLVFALSVAAMLWPLPLLAAAPGLWRSAGWRRVILGYGVAFVVYAGLAAWLMVRNAGMFFG